MSGLKTVDTSCCMCERCEAEDCQSEEECERVQFENQTLRAQLSESQAEAKRYKGLIEEVEWVQPPDKSMYPRCPWCDAVKPDGHRRMCALDAALRPTAEGTHPEEAKSDE